LAAAAIAPSCSAGEPGKNRCKLETSRSFLRGTPVIVAATRSEWCIRQSVSFSIFVLDLFMITNF
jgi:hypothetical protein